MDSKMKHRLLGVVVVAGLAVLAYPFVIGGSSIPAEQVVVKAPPFPEQAVQVSAADDNSMPSDNSDTQNASPDNSNPTPDTNSDASSPPPSDSSTPDTSSNTSSMNNAAEALPQTDVNVPAANVEQAPQAAPTTADANVNPSAAVEPAATDNSQQAAAEPEAAPQPVEEAAPAPAPVSAKKVAHKKHKDNTPVLQSKLTSKSSILAYKKTPIDNNGLMKLKKAAWVIQLGSFKDKSNALRLVNKLRAKGYRAFIQHVNVASGENTRVFVGPEHQQASARLVAVDLKKNMKLQGIVISYKPFSL